MVNFCNGKTVPMQARNMEHLNINTGLLKPFIGLVIDIKLNYTTNIISFPFQTSKSANVYTILASFLLRGSFNPPNKLFN